MGIGDEVVILSSFDQWFSHKGIIVDSSAWKYDVLIYGEKVVTGYGEMDLLKVNKTSVAIS